MSADDWDRDDARTRAYFEARLASHGEALDVVDWRSAEGQGLRFAVLAAVGVTSGVSVLDAGCGRGDLYGWLARRGLTVDYTGIDLTPGMIALAQRRYPQARFSVGDARGLGHGQYDYALASGMLYLRTERPLEYVLEAAAGLFRASRIAAAFNCLSRWSDGDVGEFRADPEMVLARCRAITPHVVLRHDYHPGDFTIYLRHTPAAT